MPSFTAATSIYRGRHTYRSGAAAGPFAPALTPSANFHDQDFCYGRELDANYPHPETCEKCISCDLSGRAQEMDCVSGLHYMQDETRWGHCD